MKNSNINKNTLVNNSFIGSRAPLSSLDQPKSLDKNQGAKKTGLMDQAQSLNVSGGVKRFRKNAVNRDHKQLMKLPNEMKHAIFSNLNQKDLENFFQSIEENILLGMAAISSAKPISDATKRCIDLLKMALMHFPKDIYFNTTIYKILKCAKRLGIEKSFENSPLLHVDFSSGVLKDFSYPQFKDLFKGTNCGFKSVVLQGLKEEELVFSTKGFPKLETLKIEEADALKIFELDDDLYTCEKLELVDCTELRSVDVQDAFQLVAFTCTNAENLENLKVNSTSRIESFDLSGCSLNRVDLDLLAEGFNLKPFAAEGGLKNSCKSLDLSSCITEDPTQLVRFISSLRNLKELNLYDLPITDVNFLNNLTHLEKVNLSCFVDSFGFTSPLNLSALRKLKEINLSGRTIVDFSFLSPLKSLERIDLSETHIGNEAIVEALRFLPQLRALNLRQNDWLTHLNFLNLCRCLEELDLSGCDAITAQGFSVLARLSQLRKLTLGRNNTITDLNFLSPLFELEQLNLEDYPNLEEGAYSVLQTLPKLHTLAIQSCSKSFSLSFLSNCYNLQDLDLSFSFLNSDPEIFNDLMDLTGLRKLDLTHTNIKNLENLSCLTSLRELKLAYTPITKLGGLEPLVLLQALDLSGCNGLDKAEVEAFQALRPQCKVIYDRTTSVPYEPEDEENPFSSDEEGGSDEDF